MPCGLVDTDGVPWIEQFEGPYVPGSQFPALLGIKALRRNNALIECRTGKIWFLGEGGAEITPSPGSRCFQQVMGPSGHWLLPVHRFHSGAKSKNIALMTGIGHTPVYPTTTNPRRARSAEPNSTATRISGPFVLSTDYQRDPHMLSRARSCDAASRVPNQLPHHAAIGGTRSADLSVETTSAVRRGRSSDQS